MERHTDDGSSDEFASVGEELSEDSIASLPHNSLSEASRAVAEGGPLCSTALYSTAREPEEASSRQQGARGGSEDASPSGEVRACRQQQHVG